jgi:transcriptional regulator with XRE-family HTH domain
MNINEAVRALRQELGDTQQSFAVRLGLAVSTIVKYEANRTPRVSEISRFLDLALSKKRHDLVEVFAGAMSNELNVKTEHVPRTLEERLLVDLLLLVMRNRTAAVAAKRSPEFSQVDSAFRNIRKHLIHSFELLAAQRRKGEMVLDIPDAAAFAVLEIEVQQFKESHK